MTRIGECASAIQECKGTGDFVRVGCEGLELYLLCWEKEGWEFCQPRCKGFLALPSRLISSLS